MILQLTSGIGGPPECTYAVNGVFQALKLEFPGIQVAASHAAQNKDCYRSITFACEEDLSFLEGTILWVCKSPLRPHHKRKNWYIGCSVIPETDANEAKFEWSDVHMERFHSGGHGGQNVNKVETGVRLAHMPTGIAVTCTAERTQHANRCIAEKRLVAILADREAQAQNKRRDGAWREHASLKRGDPVRTYRGLSFELDV